MPQRVQDERMQEARRLVSLQRWISTRTFKELIPELSAEQRHYLTERATFLTFCKVVIPGDTVFDLGANVGDHTRTLSAIVGTHGRVHAFEPNPLLVPALREIGANVTVHEIAASDHDGDSVLHVPDGRDSWASLTDRRELLPDEHFRSHPVKVRALDGIAALRDEQPKFIKIDVEGHELAALRGMTGILARNKPIVVLENPDEKICQFFESVEYRLFDFFGDSQFPLYPGLFNAIAIPYGFQGYQNLFLSERDYMFLFMDYLGISDLK
ncbi:MAG TPA: FkbM family methyltransferase [Lysobacter sp.]